jgi:hypothetical protein
VRHNAERCQFGSSASWVILSPIERSIKEKIEKIGVPLKEWDISINYGIKTGFNEAFIITEQKRTEILSNCANADERKRTDELIRPILRGRDIKRYSYEWAGLYLIATHNGIPENNILRIEIEKYPAVKKHLDSYWTKIKKRSDQGDTPYNLRSCAYMEDFSKPKIAWSDIATEPSFSFVADQMFFNNTCYIMTGAHSWVLGFLNSTVMKWYFPKIATDLGEKGTRYFKQFVEILPVPELILPHINIINDLLLRQNYTDIDAVLYSFFGFDGREIQSIETCCL